ncbi:cell division protein FtsZ [Pontixanthobacter sp. CEM42]|uniref:cell division protein FtsZ n=1 Tax=Pontixanthobacter sp. CEM42 TaxID=2792077 RepID=UPI001ADF4A4C|nr:cell division protein FtsZ [Pontixanthobacter sp. CEM42]
MSINIGPAASDELRPKITVIGVGGAGGNAIANMIAAEIEGVDFIVANTDAQALNTAATDARIQLGPDITGGLGAGARPEVGKAAAEETVTEIEDALDGVNMLFIAAGMGGGTGTGAAAVIAEAARRKGVLTVGVVTKPFLFEGTRRMRAAESGIEELQKHVDTLIVIPNQNLFLVAKAETTFKEAFQLADEVLQQGVRSITDLMVMPGLINLDFADVKSVMEEMGKAMMGTGEGEGENRALEAAERAIANPLLDGVSMQGAKGVIISIIGGEDMKLLEVDEAANHIRELVDEDANIIWGSAFNPDLDGKIRVSVVATGIEPGAGAVDASGETHSLSLGASRAPKRPVLELPEDEEIEEEAPAAQPAAFAGLDLSDEVEEDLGDDGDVDGIVDPLAGLRQDIPEPYEAEEAQIADPADDSAHANPGDGDGFVADAQSEETPDDADWGEDPEVAAVEEPLDLTAEAGGDVAAEPAEEPEEASDQDELLLNADKLAAEDEPVQAPTGRRRGLISGGEGGDSGGGGAGSTLFERMANLSRGSHSSDEEETEDEDEDGDDNDGGALNIPRFLGRQNNQ